MIRLSWTSPRGQISSTESKARGVKNFVIRSRCSWTQTALGRRKNSRRRMRSTRLPSNRYAVATTASSISWELRRRIAKTETMRSPLCMSKRSGFRILKCATCKAGSSCTARWSTRLRWTAEMSLPKNAKPRTTHMMGRCCLVGLARVQAQRIAGSIIHGVANQSALPLLAGESPRGAEDRANHHVPRGPHEDPGDGDNGSTGSFCFKGVRHLK